jgi:Spy/CpxP family protein refolding chaperone
MGLPGLELTDTQRDQVRAIVQQERPANAGEHQKLHRQLRAELLADSPDEQKIDTLRQQLAQARADALSHEISVQRKIAQVLTPEQRAKAREALAAEPDGRRGRRGRGPGGPLF